MKKTSSSWNFGKFYFSFVSLVAVLGVVIAMGIAGYSWIRQVVITDEEYIAGRGDWRLEQCENMPYGPYPKPVITDGEGIGNDQNINKKKPEEIKKCKDKAIKNILLQRNLDTKEAVIGGLVWGILFLILFLAHYPRMAKQTRSEEEVLNTSSGSKASKGNAKTKAKKRIAKK